MKKVLGIELTDEEFDSLVCEQNKDKKIKVINGKVVATERTITDAEKKAARIAELKNWFDIEYTYKEQKYRRLVALNLFDDDGIAADVKLNELYLQAEKYRREIQQLET